MKDIPFIGAKEYKLTIDRLYKSVAADTEPRTEYRNTFWTAIKETAAELGISNGKARKDTLSSLEKLIRKARRTKEAIEGQLHRVRLTEHKYEGESIEWWRALEKLGERVYFVLNTYEHDSFVHKLISAMNDSVLTRVTENGHSDNLDIKLGDIHNAIRKLGTFSEDIRIFGPKYYKDNGYRSTGGGGLAKLSQLETFM